MTENLEEDRAPVISNRILMSKLISFPNGLRLSITMFQGPQCKCKEACFGGAILNGFKSAANLFADSGIVTRIKKRGRNINFE